jgi:hypothetical protein
LQSLSDVLYTGSENAGFLEGGVTRVRAEPFDAIELDLGILWADVDLGHAR